MSAKPYAEVIVNVTAKKLDKVFHYHVPQHLKGRLVEGMRVLVPFGRRKVEGYILGFSDTAEVSEVKDIIDIVEEEPVLDPNLLALAGWMTERYMCSMVDAIRCMMPAEARVTGRKFVVPVNTPVVTPDNLSPVNSEVYSYITNRGKVPFHELSKVYGQRKSREAVRQLKELGLVEVMEYMKPGVKTRLKQRVISALEDPELAGIIAQLKPKAPKQAAVLQVMRDTGGALGVAELAGKAGVAPATVRELIKKGYLVAEQWEVRRDPYAARNFEATLPFEPTEEQLRALMEINKAIDSGNHETFLLQGVTGSGKTEVYLQAIAHCLTKGRQAIVLVPEISLTPQMVERFKGRFGDMVAVLHSRLSAGERYDEWRRIKEGRVKVAVGARSAVFAPFADPGLIIVDEEHEYSYKQEDNPKYHARDIAIARGRLGRSVVVLGSATPSLEAYTRAVKGKYKLLHLQRRVKGQPLPPVEIVDLREEMRAGHRGIFSRQLIKKINNALANKEQVILFLNRRGYSTFVVCRECGLVMKCPKCSITLTLHAGENTLRCHYCDFSRKVPDTCPRCGSRSIRHFGVGTQKVEEEAAKWFPGAAVARMDMDTTARKGSHEEILNRFKEGKIDILVGTQMIAKGLDFPGVTLVGVVTADTSLNLPDFRAAERTFQLLTQVAGRAGRGDSPGQVIIQTYNPEHYSIINAQRHDYRGFYREEMKIREVMGYPPFSSLVRIVIYGTEENSVIRGAEILAEALRRALAGHSVGNDQPLLGPAPAPINRLRGRYRWHICVRGKPGRLIRRLVKESVDSVEKDKYFGALGISVDVDPLGLM